MGQGRILSAEFGKGTKVGGPGCETRVAQKSDRLAAESRTRGERQS